MNYNYAWNSGEAFDKHGRQFAHRSGQLCVLVLVIVYSSVRGVEGQGVKLKFWLPSNELCLIRHAQFSPFRRFCQQPTD